MSNQFETGATTAQANNLILSVLNDGSVYDTRKHCGFALLQGAAHGKHSFRELVQNEAQKQRREFKSTFKPQHISEAAKLVETATIAHCFEIIAGAWNGAFISASCRRWWDKVSGNSYFSVHISIPTGAGIISLNVPFQYGYGSHWEYVTVDTLRIIGLELPKAEFNRELPIHFDDQGWTLKRNAYHGVYISKK